MPFVRALYLLPLGCLCASLAGQEPPSKSAENPVDQRAEATVKAEAPDGKKGGGWRQRCSHQRHFHGHSTFGAYVQVVMPLRDLREDLDQRKGYGLGMQWVRDHGDWHGSRTRLEWNTFPEGGSESGTRTYAKNVILSWDHLVKLNQGRGQAYLVTGIGGSRWYLEHTTAGIRESQWTTKLAISGGIGIHIAKRVNLEALYVVSGINRTFDANTLQMSLGWRF